MQISVQFNHFNCAHWVAVRCEASGASEATPAVVEASEASGSYLYRYIVAVRDLSYITLGCCSRTLQNLTMAWDENSGTDDTE